MCKFGQSTNQHQCTCRLYKEVELFKAEQAGIDTTTPVPDAQKHLQLKCGKHDISGPHHHIVRLLTLEHAAWSHLAACLLQQPCCCSNKASVSLNHKKQATRRQWSCCRVQA